MILDLLFVEETCLQKSFSTVLVSLLDLADILLQSFLLIFDPVFECAKFILEDGGSLFLNFSCHTFFSLISLVALIAALNLGLEVGNFSVKGDKVVESVFEAIGEDVPIVGVSLFLFLFG